MYTRRMLDLRYVTEHLDEVRQALQRRGPEAAASLERIAELSEQRRRSIRELEQLRAQKNEASAEMAKLDKKSDAFTQQRDAMRGIAARIKELEPQQRDVEAEIKQLLLEVPNLPDAATPDGQSEADNPVVRTWGEKPSLGFAPKLHDELGQSLGIVDMERAAKISGARFAVLRGAGARLERALMAFMLDLHTAQHGYTEIWPPALIKASAMQGTGQLPKFAADAFRIADWQQGEGKNAEHLYLAPTAEVPLTNLHAGEILEGALPRYTAYTPCFRSEAGSHGKDTRGLIRLHQFDKVELVRFERAEEAEQALEALTGHAEEVLRRLGLHYRVVQLCSGDLGFSARKTYDLEVWLPGQDAYREISSCSWFGDFQARRANIRHRPASGEKPSFVHTLNGSGLAIGRTLVAILEQYQQDNESVRVPEALRPYMGGLEHIA